MRWKWRRRYLKDEYPVVSTNTNATQTFLINVLYANFASYNFSNTSRQVFGGFAEEKDEVTQQVEAQPDDPMVCITHLHAVLEGQNCKQEEEEKEGGKEEGEEEEKEVEKCKLCGDTFESKRELLSHLKIHKSRRIFEETQLDSSLGVVERTEEKAKVKQRKKRKRSPGPILCPNCGSSFNTKPLVTRHQRYAQ